MLTATVSALYSMPNHAGVTVPFNFDNRSARQGRARWAEVGRTRSSYLVDRPEGPEYQVTQEDEYEVDEVVFRCWLIDGLDPVAEIHVSIAANTPRGMIRALKDLQDPLVRVLSDNRALEEWYGFDHEFGHRGLVVEMTGGWEGLSGSRESDSLIARLMFKDDDIHYELARTEIEMPNDLNAPIGTEIYVWDTQTLVWRTHPVARQRHGHSFAEVTAAVVACLQTTDALLDEVRTLSAKNDTTTDSRLGMILSAQASLERHVQAPLDRLSTSLGRPAAAHLAALVRQTRVDTRIRTVADLLARSRQTIELELSLRERELSARTAASTADVRTIVVLFALVSVVISVVTLVIDFGQLPNPETARFPSLALVTALALLFGVGAAVLSLSLLSAAQTALSQAHTRVVRPITAMLAAAGVAGCIWVIMEPQPWVVAASVACVVGATLLLALQLRLAHVTE